MASVVQRVASRVRKHRFCVDSGPLNDLDREYQRSQIRHIRPKKTDYVEILDPYQWIFVFGIFWHVVFLAPTREA